MQPREAIIQSFLQSANWGDASRVSLVADASFRRYERLERNNTPAILMDAPPETNAPVKIFADVTTILEKAGVSVPEIFHVDFSNGLMLIEDFGNDLFAQLCIDQPELENTLYRTAIECMAHFQKHASHDTLPPYDTPTYLRESDLVLDWYYPHVTGQKPTPAQITEFRALITQATTEIGADQPCAVLRDFHAENLLWLPERAGLKRVGLLDYQDALAGHPAYDLVSLLEDARRDTSSELRSQMLEYYLTLTGHEPHSFMRAYHTLGAQRNLKIIGIFTRLALRDGKSQYLGLIARVWGHLLNDLSHPALKPLSDWVQTNLPDPTKIDLQSARGSDDA